MSCQCYLYPFKADQYCSQFLSVWKSSVAIVKADCQKFKQTLDQKQSDPTVLGEVHFPHVPYELE